MLRKRHLILAVLILLLSTSTLTALAQSDPVIWDFESGIQGWYQNSGNNFQADRGLAPGMAPDGHGALTMTVDYSGTTFEDAGASVILNDSQCMDLTQYTHYEVEFFIPEGFPVGSDGKVWAKYGDWAWAESAAIRIDEANDVTWSVPLSQIEPLGDNPPNDWQCIREVGFKIGSSVPYAGLLFVKEVRLIQQTAASTLTPTSTPTVSAPTATPSVSEATSTPSQLSPWVWDFEQGDEDWYQNPGNDFEADNGLAPGTAPDGQGALRISTKYPGGTFADAGASVILGDGSCIDLSEFTHYEIEFYLPSEFEEAGGKLWIKYSDNWYWAESDFVEVEETNALSSWVIQFARIEPYRDNPPIDWTCVMEIGFKVGGEMHYEGVFYVTEVRLTQRPPSIIIMPLGDQNRINIRSGPGETNAVVGGINKNEMREAFFRNEECTWVQIDPEKQKWVKLELLGYADDPCALPVSSPPESAT